MSTGYVPLGMYDDDLGADIQTVHPTASQAIEVMPKMALEVHGARPGLPREKLVIPGFVTRFEQDMIDLALTFTETFTTEAGKRFVERHSKLTDGENIQDDDISSRIIMWPEQQPLEMERFDGDFGSEINWRFGIIRRSHQHQQLTQNLATISKDINENPISIMILGSLYPLEDSSKHSWKHSKLFSTVLMGKSSTYLNPKGEFLHAAQAKLTEKLRKENDELRKENDERRKENDERDREDNRQCCTVFLYIILAICVLIAIFNAFGSHPPKH